MGTRQATQPQINPTWFALYIGNNRSRWRDFDGAIDELTIYGRALQPAEIQALAD